MKKDSTFSDKPEWYVSWFVPNVYPGRKLVSGPWLNHGEAERQAQMIAQSPLAVNIKVYLEEVDRLFDGVLSE